MSLKNILFLIAAFAVSGITALMANNWINAERASFKALATPAERQETTEVLVATEELRAGSFVRAAKLKWLPWPEDGIADGYVVKGKREIKEFEASVVRNALTPGQPITDALVVHPGDRGFLAAVLNVGNRAVSVPVNATSGISGFIFPGDRVDLILTSKFNAKGGDGESRARYVSKTLLTGLRVLAIDQKTESKDGEVSPAKTVTMEVTPKQAEKVAVGMAMGNLSLSLQSLARNDVAFAETRPSGFTLDTEVNSLVAGSTGGGQINVLRGDKAE
ncbi:MAG: Flp pilus assembly protein CpaB [Rhodospirillaceae bacterium]|jgi:pilus assembly protein CpaB|nr:Flp pilus assembly protein CpaB [Rhodospirillaceae bacterium]MBT4220613.1 Flp pilus assembly protein CpaB [Rhodospirillaceae bacterium]MBT4464401.1 Flp pilus assembly protein CpaB [Rhodospirillaceae bacterium]MBT5014582.1 Flp pilus assembly protein CpaB [Rhodospirillaceae bacterium]MBT5308342.1 Flp pilus assembly protein CpaB [Rhodospirillaceae bacterium]